MQENEILKSGQEKIKQALEQRSENPETLAREMLRQGDMQVTDILGWIDDQEQAAMDSGDIALLEELGDIKKAVNEAYAKMKNSLEQSRHPTVSENDELDAGWEEDTPPSTEASSTLDVDSGWDETSTEVEQKPTSRDEEAKTPGAEKFENIDTDTPTTDLAERCLETGTGFESLKQRLAEKSDIEDMAFVLSTAADKALSADDAPLEQLARMVSLAKLDARLKAELKTALAENIFQELGDVLAEKLIESPEYINSLEGFKALTDARIGEHGPRILDQKNLLSLIAAKEIFGSPENLSNIVGAIDLSNYSDELTIDDDESVVQILSLEIDKTTGGFKTSANAKIKYNSDNAVINRDFSVSETRDESGELIRNKTVKHAVFRLPEGMKSQGLAAKMFERALPEYERAGIDQISLHANIDVGGYAWASYGFDWDADETVTQLHCGGDETRFSNMTEAEKSAAFVERIRIFCEECRNNLSKIYVGLGFNEEAQPLQDILQKFSELILNPEAVTPQAIANFGKNEQLVIYRHPELGYVTADTMRENVAANKSKESDFIRFHPGKVALFGSEWYGKMRGELQISALRKKASRSLAKT